MARHDLRDWQVNRSERTQQLIELGRLVAKSGLVVDTEDDRAVIFGALVECSARLKSEERERLLLLWKRRGHREFVNTSGPSDTGRTIA